MSVLEIGNIMFQSPEVGRGLVNFRKCGKTIGGEGDKIGKTGRGQVM